MCVCVYSDCSETTELTGLVDWDYRDIFYSYVWGEFLLLEEKFPSAPFPYVVLINNILPNQDNGLTPSNHTRQIRKSSKRSAKLITHS